MIFSGLALSSDVTPIFHSKLGSHNPLLFPLVIEIDENNHIYYIELYTKKVHKRDENGNLLFEFNLYDNNWPRGIAIDNESNIYVVDATAKKVSKYSPDGQLLLSFNKTSEDATFANPKAITYNGRIYVADTYTQLSAFNTDGTIIWTNKDILPAEGVLSDPQDVAVGSNGNIYVADTGHHRITEYNSNGEYIGSFGNEVLRTPVGIAVNSMGEIFVHCRLQLLSDVGKPQIFKFSSSGELLAT